MNLVKIILSGLAILTSGACMMLLIRGYLRRRVRLLMWGGLCFVGLTVSNVFLFADIAVFPNLDLRPYRLLAALAGASCLMYALIWEPDRNGG
ncbi:MAG TPA: DUF5985 family protein [Prosthecobacter sp.]|nr:DUF5985 family protein [Prosthecobacter sp.]